MIAVLRYYTITSPQRSRRGSLRVCLRCGWMRADWRHRLDTMGDVRDFIFLDIERIRSFVAQGGGGVPTERSGGHEHQTGGQASAEGGLPFGLAHIQGQTDYHYVRSATETKSVQDAIFNE